jgi:hypothetical protein
VVQKAAFLVFAVCIAASAQVGPKKGVPGTPATPSMAAAVLSGYIIQGKPCLPLKKFTMDAGYGVNISPSGKHVGIIVEKQVSVLFEGKKAMIHNQPFPLSVEPVARDNDYYVPLEFFEKVFPARFEYNARSHVVTAQLPKNKVLKVPMKPLAAAKTPPG